MPPPRATEYIREHNGVPTLFIDGKPHSGFGGMLPDSDGESVAAARRMDLFSFSTRLDFSPDSADFGHFDRAMDRILQAAPVAHVLPCVSLDWPHADGSATAFVSQAWLADAGIALQRLLRHAEQRSGSRIIGYRLDAGDGGQWFAAAGGEFAVDRSRPAQEAFREWLTTRQFPNVEADAIPRGMMLRGAEYGIFREPANMQAAAVIEYWRFISDTVVSAIGHFARLAREVIGPHKLLGAGYGFVGQQHGSGHLALRKFLDDPNLDFGCGPDGQSAVASFAARGKLWWNELKTDDTLRGFAAALCGANGMWGHGMSSGVEPDAARLHAIASRSLDFNRSPVAEVCVVLDDDSICYTEYRNKLTELVEAQLKEMSRTGTPFSVIHGEDLARAKKHRFYIFLNHFSLSAQRARMIEEIAQAGEITLLYVYAVGLIGQAVAPTRMMRVLGMSPIELSPYPALLRVVTEGDHGEPVEYGLEEPIAPVISCEDRRVEVLGRLIGNNRPGLVRKRAGQSTLIYSAAPHLPATLLRRLFKDAGVHLYAEAGRSVWANESFIAVAGAEGGGTLAMPKGERLYDVLEERELDLRDGQAELTVDASVMFRGSPAEWRGH